MIQTPFFNRALEDSAAQKDFVTAFVKAHDRNSKAYSKVMVKIINHFRETNDRLTHLTNVISVGTTEEQTEAAEAYSATSVRLSCVAGLIEALRFGIQTNVGKGWALAIIRVNYDKCLGTVKNLARLRSFMSDIAAYDDADEVHEAMSSRLNAFRCDDCCEWEYEAKGHETYCNQNICRECADSNYRWSSVYDQYVYYEDARDARNSAGDRVVIHYEDDNYEYNEDDDDYYHYDYSPEPEILGSYHTSKRRQRVIHDEWSDSRSRWLGVELECEVKHEHVTRENKARQLNDLINGGDIGSKVFFETDGSLNYGIEIITQPMSLPMHRDVWQWLNDKEAVKHLRSHNTTTCGLHVHVSRQPLTQDQIAKMVVFVNDRANEQLIKAVARRYAEGYCRIKEKDVDNAAISTGDRYEAINITGDKTIEFRIFKGSLKYESVLAAIEFANALTEFTRLETVGVRDLTTEKFMDFISSAKAESQVLTPYINNRLELA